MTADKLEVFEAQKDGAISVRTAATILEHVKTTRALSSIERRPALVGLDALVNPPPIDPV